MSGGHVSPRRTAGGAPDLGPGWKGCGHPDGETEEIRGVGRAWPWPDRLWFAHTGTRHCVEGTARDLHLCVLRPECPLRSYSKGRGHQREEPGCRQLHDRLSARLQTPRPVFKMTLSSFATQVLLGNLTWRLESFQDARPRWRGLVDQPSLVGTLPLRKHSSVTLLALCLQLRVRDTRPQSASWTWGGLGVAGS